MSQICLIYLRILGKLDDIIVKFVHVLRCGYLIFKCRRFCTPILTINPGRIKSKDLASLPVSKPKVCTRFWISFLVTNFAVGKIKIHFIHQELI